MAVSSAYGRASCAWRVTSGIAANTSPAYRPARRERSRRAMAAMPRAAAAMAIAEGSLVSYSLEPAKWTTGHSSR